MSNDNLELWNSVCQTATGNTKKAKKSGMRITAICPQSQRKAATKVFGPFGKGWGVKGGEYTFLDFFDQTKLCTYTAELWYTQKDVSYGFPIQANIKVCFKTQGEKGYLKIDDEYAKKVATDALTKGLSMLGFNSDIFEGKYDDNKYVQQVDNEIAAKEYEVEFDKYADHIRSCLTIDELKALWANIPNNFKEGLKDLLDAVKLAITEEAKK